MPSASTPPSVVGAHDNRARRASVDADAAYCLALPVAAQLSSTAILN
jgi:hypothetical protein